VQHLNIPKEVPEYTIRAQTLKQLLKISWTNTKWMLIALISPEAFVGKAFQDLMMARRSVREMAELAEIDGVPWTVVHAQYANMGGFKFKVQGWMYEIDSLVESTISNVSFERVYEVMIEGKTAAGGGVHFQTGDAIKRTELATGRYLEEGEKENGTQVGDENYLETGAYPHPPVTGPLGTSQIDRESIHSFPERMKQEQSVTSTIFSQRSDSRHNTDTSSTERRRSSSTERSTTMKYIYPNAGQLRLMREANVIHRLPSISTNEILSKTNPEPLAKTIAVFQALWYIIQVVARAAKKLPISQLEIATLAFIACALMIYLLNWTKPQGITTPTEVNHSRPIIRGEKNDLKVGLARFKGSKAINRFYPRPSRKKDDYMCHPPPNDLLFNDGPEFLKINGWQYFNYQIIALSLSGIVFGGIHLLAWDFVFPSYIESVLWKAASLYIAGTLALFPVIYIGGLVREYTGWERGVLRLGIGLNCVFTGVYLVAKLGLVVVMVRSLFSLPRGAFVGTWAEEIPHLA
jgi:hypothetical protein